MRDLNRLRIQRYLSEWSYYMTFTELRKQYPEFVFSEIRTKYESGKLHLTYFFDITGLCSFAPTWEIPCFPAAL